MPLFSKFLDNGNGETAQTVKHITSGEPLNTGYYHRVFKMPDLDAMGENTRRRGFNDRNIFMAETTNPRIASKSATFCRGRGRNRKCNEVTQRWTYAIPLEIIYLTPLSSWNPYNLEYKGEANSNSGRVLHV